MQDVEFLKQHYDEQVRAICREDPGCDPVQLIDFANANGYTSLRKAHAALRGAALEYERGKRDGAAQAQSTPQRREPDWDSPFSRPITVKQGKAGLDAGDLASAMRQDGALFEGVEAVVRNGVEKTLDLKKGDEVGSKDKPFKGERQSLTVW